MDKWSLKNTYLLMRGIKHVHGHFKMRAISFTEDFACCDV